MRRGRRLRALPAHAASDHRRCGAIPDQRVLLAPLSATSMTAFD